MKFLKDIEVNLEEHDLLNTKVYANSLVDVIEHAPSRFTVGLFGEWGSGKSSIIRTAQVKLESSKDKKIKFITYDAWKYANDSFRRTFLFEMANSLKIKSKDREKLFNDFYLNQNKDTEVIRQNNYSFIFFFFLVFAISIVAIPFFDFETTTEVSIQVFIAILGLGVSYYRMSSSELKVSISKPLVFAPEQFEECFNELVDKALNKPSDNKWFKSFSNKYDSLVIVIDNIDRCDKKLSYELLTNIKNFLGEKENVTFIIPLDNSALKRHLKINDSSEKEADEFLRKFFNVTLTIKPFKALDLYDYTNDLNAKEGLNLKPDSVAIISDEYASNPRRIIQLLNNLSTEFEVLKYRIGEEFVLQNQSLIVKIMILREEWNTFYKYIFLQPHAIKDSSLENVKEFKNNKALKLFLHRTKAITNNIDTDLIEKVLYNKSNHQNISSEILESLDNNELDAIEKYLESTSNYFNLMKYLIDKLKLEMNRGTFKTGALLAFKNILKVNNIHNIEKYHNIQIEGIFSDNEHWLLLIDNLGEDDANNFFIYVNLTANQGLNLLGELSFERFQNFWSKDSEIEEEDPKLWIDYLEVFINTMDDVVLLKKLKGMFQRFYVHHFIDGDYLYEKEWLHEDKLPYVIGEGLIDVFIDRLDFSLDENKYYLELFYFSEQKILKISHIQKILKKLMGLTVIVSSDTLLMHMQELTKIFKNIPAEAENMVDIITYINSLQTNRAGLNVNNQKVTINLLNELNNDEEKIKKVLGLYLEIYRMTRNKTNVVALCTALLNKYPTKKPLFYKMLIDLRNECGFSLRPLFNMLLAEDAITEDILDLYFKIFIHSEVNIEKVKEKLSKYIEQITSGDDKTSVSTFIDNIIDNKIIEEIVSQLVQGLDLQEIKMLPIKTQSLAYDSFDEDIALVENDIDILKEMLKTPKYIENIIGVIIGKLQYKTKVKDALKLVVDINQLSDEQKNSLLTALKKRKGGEKFNQQVNEQIKRLNIL